MNASIWAKSFSNGELSVLLPNDWEMDLSDQYGTYFNSNDKAEQLVTSSLAMKTVPADAELQGHIEKLVELRIKSIKTQANGAEPRLDKKLIEAKGGTGSAVLRGLCSVQSVFFDIRIIAVSGKIHTFSYYCYRCRTMDTTTIQRGEALLGAVKIHGSDSDHNDASWTVTAPGPSAKSQGEPWKREKSADGKSQQSFAAFENAKEATRRAVFLNVAGKMSSDATYKQQLAEIFQLCRSAAITAGVALGYTETQIDAELSELCDADTRRLKVAPEKVFTEFARESGEIVMRFLGPRLGNDR